MKVINKKMCVVFVLVILEISSLFLMYKSNSNKEIKLDSVENKIEDNSLFALMIEQTIGTYTTSSSTTWPTGYVLNPLKSGCVDNDGNKIKDGMKYDKTNNKVIIDTDKTSNCYVYLSKSTYDRISVNSQVWNSDLSNDGYRYYGSQDGTLSTIDSVPNYVCFGTQSKSECVSDTDKYMYRIIGMFQEETTSGGYNIVNSSSDYHLKLIKKEALNKVYSWHSDNQADTNWSASDLYKGLNGDYFVTNMDYYYMQDDFWYSKIKNWKWTVTNTKTQENGGLNYFNTKQDEIYLNEMNRELKNNKNGTSEFTQAKIGLIYVSDYLLSLGNEALSLSNSFNSSREYKKGWMHLSNNDTAVLSTSNVAPPNLHEKTISRFGLNTNYGSWTIASAGTIATGTTDKENSVRPAFYLNSDVVICSGSGTSSNPYILG